MSRTSDASTADIDSLTTDATRPPPLSALFLIKFDQKVGLELDGAVEFKSLPSGLHTVKEDLVYFIHEGYGGLSAFANGPASESERNAHLVAVGILVPLSYGRLGRSWLHAQSLQDLAAVLVDDVSKTEPLEQFWEQFRSDHKHDARNSTSDAAESSARPGPSWKGHSRSRALSSLTAVLPTDQSLPPLHPALSIVKYIDTFGPLVFPLHRAALLRKRILFIAPPPVRLTCEFVYDLSILSSIPASVSDLLPTGLDSVHRLRSFFNLGIHDIPLLEKEAAPKKSPDTSQGEAEPALRGWVACTTDEILSIKKNLYDIIVELPATQEHAPQEHRWPTIKTSEGTEVRASQRDLRRFKILHRELWKIRHGGHVEETEPYEDTDDHTALLPHDSGNDEENESNEGYDNKLIEPMTWSQLAYSGFMWWASAGEKDAYLIEEADRDREMLGDLSDFIADSTHTEGNGADPMTASGLARAGLHTAIIAYFHRLTSQFVSTLADLADAAEDEDSGDSQEGLVVGSDDITRMGLDAWNESDKAFARDFLFIYFGREAEVQGASLECCGIRIC
ncbi:hypothetical protein AOQ84DRAFT_398801 [Glonium stellatum]|uniref:DUF4484 domain-containing protein n=1 Tax=Glonium stellatum TaxID=574774 RepID=A0A8E2JRI5_9PEZI|nr:hypothetical protein AOQ84DRAFT_398801 [Glonium stellatum]